MTKKFWVTALTFGIPWAILMIVYKAFIEDGLTLSLIVSTLIAGLIAGLLFAGIMHHISKRLAKTIIPETAANERILKEGGANHLKGIEAVGGKLVLTDKRLIFTSHTFNWQNHQEHIDLDQIQSVQSTRTLGVLPNGLTIQLPDNKRHKFIVDEPGDWVEKIMTQKQQGH